MMGQTNMTNYRNGGQLEHNGPPGTTKERSELPRTATETDWSAITDCHDTLGL